MKYVVTAMSVDPRTGEITGKPRVEVIDTKTNELFSRAIGPWEVEDRYAAFWNRLNDSWEDQFPKNKDKVVVLSVVKAPK